MNKSRAESMKLKRLIAFIIMGLFLIPAVTIANPSAAMGSMSMDGVVPHYFGPYPNYATSQLPNVTYDINGNITSVTGGIRKFVDSLPGLGEANANNLGQYMPVAVPDRITYPGSDYYEIAVVEFEEKMHSDLNPTKLRGYVQLETPINYNVSKHVSLMYLNGTPILKYNGTQAIAVDNPHYLGPFIIAQKDVPVRVKFTNLLPIGLGGDLFLPVDTTVMGAGMGPLAMVEHVMITNGGMGYTSAPTVALSGGGGTGATAEATIMGGMVHHVMITNSGMGYTSAPSVTFTGGGGTGATAVAMIMFENYTQNRATLHLHGGRTPWISDGTPHQWITPAGESTSYPKGVSVYNVPDMPDPGPGSMTFYYTNQQSARLMFYHDHSYGITRLNVYAGEAAGYLLQDDVELALISAGIIPADQIPLVIQDKTFVPDNTTPITNMWGTFPSQLSYQDPTWNTSRWGTPGDLWYPHVYMTMSNPYDPSGMSMFGRWMYAPWFWPPRDIQYGPIPNPYYNASNPDPMEPPMIPGVPFISEVGEAFMDTPVINGAAYPYLEVNPKPYRFRILNAADDRFFNLQFYVADESVTTWDGRHNTEVKMVPAVATPGFPESWPTDGREGGVPDPATAGPEMIQIANEGGFLPTPVILPNQPVDWNWDQGTFDFGILAKYTLLLGCAERADVIVDFSKFAGKTLILYNDCPAPTPASDPRQDYFTGHPDYTDSGGSQTTIPGYGSNTRTLMQIRVKAIGPAASFDIAKLLDAFNSTANHNSVFQDSQNDPIVPQSFYNSAYNATFPRVWANIFTNSLTFTPIGGTTPVTLPFKAKAIQDEMGEAYDHKYGRMAVQFGLQVTTTLPQAQTLVLYGFASPPTEVQLAADVYGTPMGVFSDGTEIWKIVHNGVDVHPVHWHMFEVQLINRVAWDNNIRETDPNELGWKETLRVNPLQNTIVALRPILPNVPFDIPNSIRPLDPTMPIGAVLDDQAFSPNAQPITVINHEVNFGWEYVWHCHILAHEENDMMRTMAMAVPPIAPSNLVVSMQQANALLNWVDNSLSETGFVVERANDTGFTLNLVTFKVGKNVTTYLDNSISSNKTYYYRVKAINIVGDIWDYVTPNNPNVMNFPTLTTNSAYSNVRIFDPKTPHAPIFINGNSQFTSSNGVVSGSGTALDPFVIERWSINASTAHGIFIMNTNAYFIVRKCEIYSGGSSYSGIYLYNSVNGVLIDNICSNNLNGIYLSFSSHNTIDNNNYSSNNRYGIFLYSSSSNSIDNNICSSNIRYGMYLFSSSNNIISNNTCNGNLIGLYIVSSSNNNMLINNNCTSNSQYGICLYSSSNNIANINFCSSNGRYGIYLYASSNNLIRNNSCNSNIRYGMYLLLSSSNTISNNTCNSNLIGIYVASSSNNNALIDNICISNSQYGICLSSSSSNLVTGNKCYTNGRYGMYIYASSNNILRNNNCSSNTFYGIYLLSSNGNQVDRNNFFNNVRYGVCVYSASGNAIWNNTFVANNGATSVRNPSHLQAYDAGTGNWWNSTSGYGNYWSDWTSPDGDLDGIVDSPYVLAGPSSARDECPLVNPPE